MSMTGQSPGEDGAGSTEYLFLMVLIALAIVVGARAFGSTLGDGYADSGEQVTEELSR